MVAYPGYTVEWSNLWGDTFTKGFKYKSTADRFFAEKKKQKRTWSVVMYEGAGFGRIRISMWNRNLHYLKERKRK